jgi:NADH-quinone oxidoreductase subunit A
MSSGAGTAWWALVLYGVFAALTLGAMLVLPRLLGQRHRELTTDEQYESGLPMAEGGLPRRYSIEFFLVAILFVVFDLESVFIFAWAVTARRLGWVGYVEMLVFIALLMAALVYLWASGALDWGTGARQKARRRGGT